MVDPQGTGGLLTSDTPAVSRSRETTDTTSAAVPSARTPLRLVGWGLALALIAAVIGVQRPSVHHPTAATDRRPGAPVRDTPQVEARGRPPAADAPLDVPSVDADAMVHAAAREAGTFDGRLLSAYARFARGDAAGAVAAAKSLSESTPSSGLAQLAYADMLRLRLGAAPVSGWGASSPSAARVSTTAPSVQATATAKLAPGSEVSQQARLDDLLAEARARVATAQPAPPDGTVPSQFLQLAPGVGHAIAVDVARSRAYLLASGPAGWTVQRDYYASVGKLGWDKHSEGDLRTPLGVYFVTGTVAKTRMADRFGSTALTLNYPNQYDQLSGRTGNGIWLHGVPASLHARAPLATDGCVALSNDDMNDLARHVDRQQTPILIAPTLDWVPAIRADTAADAFLATFAQWRTAHAAPDADPELAFYSSTLRTPAAASGPAWGALLQGERHGRSDTWAPVLGDVSVVGWRDDRPVMVVTFRERARAGAPPRLRRQYWVAEDGRWRIIYEGDVG